MKSIQCLNDLREFGITPLTGEACAIGLRCLCDLTEEGRDTVAECFGIMPQGFKDNWNSGGVASFMLPYDSLRPLSVVVLLRNGCCAVALTERHGVIGLTAEDFREFAEREGETDPVEHIRTFYGLIRTYGTHPDVTDTRPTRGLSCVHAMSGRSA